MGEATNIHQAAEIISMIGQPKAEPETPPPPIEEPQKASPEVTEPAETAPEPAAQEEPRMEAEEAPAEEAAPEPTQETQGDAQEIEIEPAHLAQLLGIDESDLAVSEDGGLQLSAKVDGEVHKVTLRDLKDSYQLAKTSQQRLSKLAEERKAFDNERQEILQNLGYQQQQLANAMQALEQDYVNNFNAVDWQRLRDEDPTEYNLKRNDYEDRRRKIEDYKASVQQQTQQLQAQQNEQINKAQREGAQRLSDVFAGPEYRSAPSWGESEQNRLFKWITSQGYSREQVNQVTDWQLFKWARDSMLYQEQQKAAKETLKRVVKLPKISKPGTKKSAQSAKRTRLDEAKTRQRKTRGSLKATQELISEIMRS
ncbi:MAG: hypothetical protein R3260_18490 [Pseudomonas sp.]|nr:hypothetical protein [Pseudomonas sp.]